MISAEVEEYFNFTDHKLMYAALFHEDVFLQQAQIHSEKMINNINIE